MSTKTTAAVIFAAALAVIAAAILWLPGSSPTATPAGFTLPPGFEIELAAGPPLTERPIVVDMDELGRLYVAESSGSNEPVKVQLEKRPHSILRLEDTDNDGRFDKRVVFADRMMFPEGVLWYDGSLYVAAPPSIWKLTDTDGDGVADRREEWFNGQTLTNCANDLHGPYLGPDGWLYWCKGGFAEQIHEQAAGRPPLVSRAGHIFRRRPEGGPLESVMAGGMDNPVEVAFSPEGERFLTATFVEHPTLGRRDGILHALYGGVYGKIHNVTDSHPQTGGYQQPMLNLDAAVPVGLTWYGSTLFGEHYKGDLFATLFNLHKVDRLKLVPVGASYDVERSDFLVSTSQDFHPTDLLEDADGSLLVVDTGGWYKLCCPSSQLAKADVPGAIYRVRPRGAKTVDDPRGLKLAWDTLDAPALTGLLADPRPAVQKRAIHELSKKGSEAVAPLTAAVMPQANQAAIGSTDHGSTGQRINAVWTLTRIHGDEARAAVRRALDDPEESVRHAAAHGVSVWRDKHAVPRLIELLEVRSEALRRAAAEALGRLGDSTAVAPILTAVAQTEDPTLTHSLTYALIEIADPNTIGQGLTSPSPKVRRAALIALDQMPGNRIAPESVIPLLSSADPILSETANWIAGHHPDWGGALSGYFRQRLASAGSGPQDQSQLVAQLNRFVADPAIQKLLADTARGPAEKNARLTALKIMASKGLKEAPASWIAAITAAATASDADILREAVATARALPATETRSAQLDGALLRVGSNAGAPDDVRADALAASAAMLPDVDPGLFDFLVAQIDPAKPVRVRGAAAHALAGAPLTALQQAALTQTLKTAGPLDLPILLGAFEKGGDESLGEKLMDALENAKGLANLRADIIETALAKFPEGIQKRGQALLASLDVDRGQQQARLDDLAATLQGGDVRRGQAIFNSSKAACLSCHRIGYLGGRIGPDLTRIGEIRNERDLLEAVVYPSASFVRSYEPVVVTTASDTYNGVPLEETDDYILLATGTDTQARIERPLIEEVRPGTVSIMPAGLEEEFTQAELADLIAFLKNTRRGPN